MGPSAAPRADTSLPHRHQERPQRQEPSTEPHQVRVHPGQAPLEVLTGWTARHDNCFALPGESAFATPTTGRCQGTVPPHHPRRPSMAPRWHDTLTRATCPTRVTHTHWTSDAASRPRGPDLPRTPTGPGDAGAWLVGEPNSLTYDWDAELTRTALQHRPLIPFLDQNMQCALCGQILDRSCDHAAVCQRGGSRLPRICPRRRSPNSEGESRTSSAPDTAGLPQRASLDRPADVSIPSPSGPEPRRSTTRPTVATRMASASPQWFSTNTLERDSATPGSLNVSAPPPTPSDINLELASTSSWLSASLRHSTVTPRVPFCEMSAWLPQGMRPLPMDQTTGRQPGMTPTPANGRPTRSLTQGLDGTR